MVVTWRYGDNLTIISLILAEFVHLVMQCNLNCNLKNKLEENNGCLRSSEYYPTNVHTAYICMHTGSILMYSLGSTITTKPNPHMRHNLLYYFYISYLSKLS